MTVFDSFASSLIGLPVSHTWRGHGSAVFIEFGALRRKLLSNGTKSRSCGKMTLMIEWSWRIESVRSIICGSWSDELRWPRSFERLLKAKVADVSLLGRLKEFDLKLSNNLHVVSFSTVEGGPRWALFDRDADSWLSVKKGSLVVGRGK